MEVGFLSTTTQEYDVLIIGGGPAGATAAIYSARAGLKTLVLDKGLATGALGMAAQIANFPGVPGPISGTELLQRIRDQAAAFGATFVIAKVLRVDLGAQPKEAWAAQRAYKGHAVIIATGALGRAKRIPGEERLLGRGVSYCATCDAAFFRGREVVVVGSSDEAVEEALVLTRFAARVHFLSPTADLHASPEIARELTTHPQVTLYRSARVQEIVGQTHVTGVRFALPDGSEQTIPADGVFVYLLGNVPIVDFLEGQLPTNESGCLVVDGDYQTAIPGVFAAGDVLCKRLKQAVLAAAEGAAAGMAVERYLRGHIGSQWSV